MGASGRISYAGWRSFGPGPAALAVGLAAPAILRFAPYYPEDGWDPLAKVIVANVINAVEGSDLERGVLDAPVPVVHPVLSGPILEVLKDAVLPESDDKPEYGVGWPDVWKKKPGDPPGWDPDQWEYPEQPGDVEVAIDWGGVVGGVFSDIATGLGAPSVLTGLQAPVVPPGTWLGGGPSPIPQKVTIDTATGKVTACRRRRRRRLLTPTDLNDLAALKTIVGGGQAINFAVMKAVRR